MPEPHSFVTLLVDFTDALRDAGIPVGTGDVLTYCAATGALDPTDIADLFWAGRASLVTRRDQIPIYDTAFRRFFLGEHEEPSDAPRELVKALSSTQSVLEVPSDEVDADQPGGDEATLGLMASDADIWRNKAFALCTPEELAALRRIMARIAMTPPSRRTRRHTRAPRGRRLDLRRMAYETMRRQREPDRLFWQRKKLRVRPLVLILDVSGSMSDYSRNLVQFAYSMKRAVGRVEVFCFGTRITRITPALARRRPDDALDQAARRVFDWDGGTRIGDSLDQFVRRWGRRGLARGAIVVICSDGLDRGDPAVLAAAMERLARLSYRIVWLNPHVGDATDYTPTSLGMMVAAPFVDTVMSGHNLRSLEDFAAALPQLR